MVQFLIHINFKLTKPSDRSPGLGRHTPGTEGGIPDSRPDSVAQT